MTMYLDGTYDVPRINAEFFIEGHRVQGPRVARDGSQLMHESTFAWGSSTNYIDCFFGFLPSSPLVDSFT